MEYRNLGRSGLIVSELGLGGNNFGGRLDVQQAAAVVDAAIDSGITLIDTAEQYGAQPGASETILGGVLRGRRDQIVLASKFGHPRGRADVTVSAGAPGGRSGIKKALESTLRRLQTDYLDLYQYHRFDPSTPLEETTATLIELVHEGKIRYFGHSCLHSWQLAEAQHIARDLGEFGYVSAQYNWNLLDRSVESDIAIAAREYGVGVIPFFPLAQGLLTGKITKGHIPSNARLSATPERVTDDKLDVVERLRAWASDRGTSVLEVSLGMLTSHPSVSSVVVGASTPDQIRSNVAAVAWKPTATDREEIDQLAPAPQWFE